MRTFFKEEGSMAILSPLEILEKKIETSRFRLAQVAAQRAKMLIRGAKPLIETSYKKPISIALEEIKAGKVSYYGPEETAKIRDDLEKRIREKEEAEVKVIQEKEKETARAKTSKEPD
ncbi:MAG: DNA-directed RNA polymerase subunit omega [Nitrospirae bacterium CG2_30_53_67]|nr:MAG: DNA-directed RNA polymerase subunit omega [Nitrospirae bacterium CG2_30_53_67]